MSNRAHRERRRRLARKTWGPGKARQLRRWMRQLEQFERGFNRLHLALGGMADAAEAWRTLSVSMREFYGIPPGSQIEFRTPDVAWVIVLPSETTGAVHDGEFWPDAHEMCHSDAVEPDPLLEPPETIAERRARLDAWLETSGDILDEQPVSEPLGIPFGGNQMHIFQEPRLSIIMLDADGQPTGPAREIPVRSIEMTAEAWVEGYLARTGISEWMAIRAERANLSADGAPETLHNADSDFGE